jgi:monolysocardiolipin acyltransferase
MDANIMPEIIPMWISGFDQIMNEYRGSPRARPRSGAKISVTVGEPITNQIEPLVQAFKRGKEDGSGEEDPTATRIAITSQLQEAVRRLGEQVEHREGRFERDEWSHSRALEEIKAPV